MSALTGFGLALGFATVTIIIGFSIMYVYHKLTQK